MSKQFEILWFSKERKRKRWIIIDCFPIKRYYYPFLWFDWYSYKETIFLFSLSQIIKFILLMIYIIFIVHWFLFLLFLIQGLNICRFHNFCKMKLNEKCQLTFYSHIAKKEKKHEYSWWIIHALILVRKTRLL